jgi:type I restriction enzyme S subunit
VEIIGIVWTAAAQSDGTHIRLGDVCTISRGKGLSKGDMRADGARPCILYGELHTRYGEVTTEVHSRTNALTTTCSQRGDVLVPSSSETHEDLANATALNEGGVLLGGDINILRPQRPGEYSAEYLAYYLRHIKRRDIARLAQGNAIVHLYGRELARLDISLPDVERQFHVAAVLRLREREITLLRQLATAYGRQKAGLMQVLLGASDRNHL